MAASTDQRHGLDGVRERRNALRLALASLEEANAGPASGRWRERMVAALDQASAMLTTHVAQTEGPGGFFELVVHDDPRVAQQVDQLRAEHVDLQRTLATLTERCITSGCAPSESRDEVTRLMGQLHAHRHAGADLLYEAYNVDIAFGD